MTANEALPTATTTSWPIITTDSHHGVPLELAEELPERYREYVPRLESRDGRSYVVRPPSGNGRRVQMMDGEPADRMTAALKSGIEVDPLDAALIRQLVVGNCVPTANPGYRPEERLADMARDGVVGEVLIGTGAFGHMLPDDDANLAWARLVNDWMADAYKDHLHQFAPGITVPLHNLDVAADEVRRAAAMGLRPLLLPEAAFGLPYADPMWDPVWDAVEEAKIPVFLHLSGALGTATSSGAGLTGSPAGGALTGITTAAAANMSTIGWFVNSGVLERHPDLTVCLIECNASWLAYAMQQWDHNFHGRFGEVLRRSGIPGAHLEAPPSYYVRRQVKCQFGWDPAAVALRHVIGLDVLIWGNDYPHLEGSYPDSQEYLARLFAGVPEEETMAIVHDNAARLLGLTV